MSLRTRIVIAAVILGAMTLVFWIPHADPTTVDLAAILQPPSRSHPLGTDDLGRDVWALMAVGFRRTLTVVLTASITSLAIDLGNAAQAPDDIAGIAALDAQQHDRPYR